MRRDHSLIFDQLWATASDVRPWVVDHESDAVRVSDGQVSPLEIATASGRAASLFESQGMKAGDRCVVWLDQPLDIVIAAAGLTAIGAVPVLISPALSVEALITMLSPLPPVDRVVTTAARAASCSAMRVRGRVDDWASLCRESEGLAARRASIPLSDDEPYVVTHTSGTTGVNKLVQYTRAAADHNSYTQEIPARIARLRGYAAVAVSPVHFRFVVGLLAALRRRIPIIVLADHDPDSVGPIIERWRPSYLETHPNTFMRWERLAAEGSLSSVKCFLSTFDVIHPGTIKNLLNGTGSRFAMLIEIYGQSEVSAIAGQPHLKGFAGRIAERNTSRRLSGHLIGWIVPGHSRIRIVDEGGKRVKSGVGGRIQVRSTGRFSTYLNRPEAVRDNLTADGWWDTGDFGTKDRMGRLTLIDRQVERLRTAPSSIAIEDVLLDRMQWLQEAVVLERDQRLMVVVSTRDGEFDLSRWTASIDDLPPLGSPIVIDDRAIPRTATGKVQRAVLAVQVGALDAAQDQAQDPEVSVS